MLELELVKRLIVFILSILFVFSVAFVLVAYGKGYRLNLDEKKIDGTGIVSISSVPEGAEIFLNNELRGGTDASIPNLPPGQYKVRLEKTGFNNWEKTIEIEKEKVTPIEVVLFPSAPDLSALTFSGITSPKLSPDSTKVAYAISEKDKAGIWVLELGSRQLFFSKSAQQIAEDSDEFKSSQAQFQWSFDSKSLLVSGKNSTGNQQNYLLDASRLNESFVDVSLRVKSLKEEWARDKKLKEQSILKSLGKEAEKLAEGATKLHFSPDEKRILIIKKGKKPLVYDSDPSLIPGTEPKIYKIPQASEYIWYPSSSRHLILVKEDSISIVESDGTNDKTIYTGQFTKGKVFAWPDGTKIVISTTLNTAGSKKPNLYSIRLR